MNQKKLKKSPTLEIEFYARIFTLNEKFANREAIGHTIEQLLKPRGFEFIGVIGKREKLIEISFSEIYELFPLEKEINLRFLAERKNNQLQVNTMWFPPEFIDIVTSPVFRMAFGFAFPKGWIYQDIEDLFTSAIVALAPNWGELNQISVTETPTHCFLGGHRNNAPHLGTLNYFGPEYCEFFGGIERINSAGFERVVPLANGVLTSLGVDLSTESYLRKRTEVESRLATLETFNPDARVDMPLFKK